MLAGDGTRIPEEAEGMAKRASEEAHGSGHVE